MTRLAVSEVFGPTLQGEGPGIGRPCVFLRVAGCPLSCRWCDTAYTWDWRGVSELAHEQGGPFDPRVEMHSREPSDVAAEVLGLLRAGDRLIVSCGEPCAQQAAVVETLYALREHVPSLYVEVETSGTIAPTPDLVSHVDQLNVSPKLAHSGDPEHRRIVPDALAALRETGLACWKFVVADAADVDEVAAIVDAHELGRQDVWLMPLGRHGDELDARTRVAADAAVAHGWNLTPRLHVLAWGDERGR